MLVFDESRLRSPGFAVAGSDRSGSDQTHTAHARVLRGMKTSSSCRLPGVKSGRVLDRDESRRVSGELACLSSQELCSPVVRELNAHEDLTILLVGSDDPCCCPNSRPFRCFVTSKQKLAVRCLVQDEPPEATW